MNVFQLLVAAIVAAAFVWVFLTYLAPLFVVPNDVVAKLHEGLKFAKNTPGQSIPIEDAVFPKDLTLLASAFSENRVDTLLECNNPSFCCDQEAICPNKIVWTRERIQFNQNQPIPAFARCDLQFEFFACKIFVGQKPGQLEFQGPLFEKTLDLERQSGFRATLQIQNTGNLATKPGIATVNAYKKKPGSAEKTLVHGQQKEIVSLAPSETIQLEIEIPIVEAGEYQIHARIEADEAGFDEQELEFSAVNQPNPCRALEQQAHEKVFDEQNNLCTEKFFCAGCSYAIECKQKWESAQPNTLFELGDYSFAQITTVSTAEQCQ